MSFSIPLLSLLHLKDIIIFNMLESFSFVKNYLNMSQLKMGLFDILTPDRDYWPEHAIRFSPFCLLSTSHPFIQQTTNTDEVRQTALCSLVFINYLVSERSVHEERLRLCIILRDQHDKIFLSVSHNAIARLHL